jgi:hypothetical protein
MDKLHMALTELCYAINYCNVIQVWEHGFVPREFFLQHLETRFNKWVHSSYNTWKQDLISKYRFSLLPLSVEGLSWSWSYGIWIYNYLCNQCLLPLTLWVQIMIRRGVLDTTLCDKVCQWLATGWWFSPGIIIIIYISYRALDLYTILQALYIGVVRFLHQ